MRHVLRPIVLALAVLLVQSAPGAAAVRVVATTEHLAAIARIVGGNRIVVDFMVKGSRDPHAADPRPSLSTLLNRADLLIVNGQGLEAAWLPSVIASSTNNRTRESKPGQLDASVGASLLPYDPKELDAPFLVKALVAVAGLVAGRREEFQLGQNHHYWLDPANGAAIARAIADRLALLDPSNAEFYRSNHATFAARLKVKLDDWDQQMKPFAGMEIVSYHRSWTYLAARHGLKTAAYVEPREPLLLAPTKLSIAPDAEDVTALIAGMAQRRVRVLVAETYQDRDLLQDIAARSGAHLALLPSSVSASEGLPDYFALFDKIYEQLTAALTRSRS